MSLSLLSRYAFFAVCVIFTLASLPFIQHEWLWPITLVTGVLFGVWMDPLAAGVCVAGLEEGQQLHRGAVEVEDLGGPPAAAVMKSGQFVHGSSSEY